MSLDNLAALETERLLILARNVKSYERSEDLSDLVLELAERLTVCLGGRDRLLGSLENYEYS